MSWVSTPDAISQLREIADTDELQGGAEGWSYDSASGGVLHIKLRPLAYDAVITIDIK